MHVASWLYDNRKLTENIYGQWEGHSTAVFLEIKKMHFEMRVGFYGLISRTYLFVNDGKK
jgi:hypothetical protein